MRLVTLHLRSRRLGWALASLLVVAAAFVLLVWAVYTQEDNGIAHGALILPLIVGALAVACVVGSSSYAPFGDPERIVARPLRTLRLAHLSGLLLLSAVLLVAPLLGFDLADARPRYPALMLARDLAALAGVALLSARFLSARLSWVPTFLAAIGYLICMTFTGTAAAPPYDGRHALSWAVAGILLLSGLLLVSLAGAREPPDEAEERIPG